MLHQKRHKKDIAVDKAVSFINETRYGKITMFELCAYADASERTLEYGFQEKFSVSPKQYIKTTKLNDIRKELLIAPNQPIISDIANKYGFHHMGQFSADYKNLFGELPSESIKKL